MPKSAKRKQSPEELPGLSLWELGEMISHYWQKNPPTDPGGVALAETLKEFL